jgi:hypothetical protein
MELFLSTIIFNTKFISLKFLSAFQIKYLALTLRDSPMGLLGNVPMIISHAFIQSAFFSVLVDKFKFNIKLTITIKCEIGFEDSRGPGMNDNQNRVEPTSSTLI